MASLQTQYFFPRFPPPPPPPPTLTPPSPPHFVSPPPPYVVPPPPPPPPPSAPGTHTAIIVVVFVSCGGVFFLAFVMASLWCFFKKKKMVRKVENAHIDEHRKARESVVQGPRGNESVMISVEDDIRINGEDIRKSEGFHNLNSGDKNNAGLTVI